MKTTRFIRLTKTIKNPEHDRRTKYGIESLPEFKEGEGFVVWTPARQDYPGEVFTYRVGNGSSTRSMGRALGQLVIDNSVDAEPVSLREVLAMVSVGGDYSLIAFSVLGKLLHDGTIPAARIIELARKVEEESE